MDGIHQPTPATRKTMQANRSKDTKPEMVVRRGLHARGLRFRLHANDLPGRPDVVFRTRKVAVFVQGCFWHGCQRCDRGLRRPKTNVSFWAEKLEENRARDLRSVEALKALGWTSILVWECDIRATYRLQPLLDGIADSVRGISHDDA